MRKPIDLILRLAKARRCRFCGYNGSDWPDSDECPSCGEVN